MRKLIAVAAVLLSTALCGFGADVAKSTGPDMNVIDKSVDPCTDFYQFACGNWLKANPIPSDQTRWGRFSELYERNRGIIREILEKAAVQNPGRSANEQKIGDYYASCMDESAIESKGLESIKPLLDSINGIRSKAYLRDEVAALHRVGVNAFFDIGSEQDLKNTEQVILGIGSGGLGLPDRDYYFRTDEKSVELRKQYVQHIAKMLELAGESPANAAKYANGIMAIETALAKNTLDVVARRTPANLYHKVNIGELESYAPRFGWVRYLQGINAPQVVELNVSEPEFLKGFDSILKSTDLNSLKAYMRFHLVSSMAPMLPKRFDEESFNFYGKTMRGAKEQQARWKRCSAYADGQLGEAVGQEFVARAFGGDSKARTQKIVAGIEEAMRKNISQIDWMTEETKKQAFVKLDRVANKIGYPENWRDYSSLSIVRGDAIGNLTRAREFEFSRRLNKIGKAVDRQEWIMSPPTVNAYYEPTMNDINFPAGILQPPFFEPTREETYNYGGIGAVIGHELTHGFDDEGRQFDEKGNLRDWWTKADNDEFNKRADCFVQQYGGFTAVEEVKLNGKLTLGENVADNGGLRLAMVAALAALGDNKDQIDGYTPEQRLFLGFGQIWCTNATPQTARMLALTDPHSLPKWRVNGTVSNMPEFQKAWGCKADAPMVRANACRVW